MQEVLFKMQGEINDPNELPKNIQVYIDNHVESSTECHNSRVLNEHSGEVGRWYDCNVSVIKELTDDTEIRQRAIEAISRKW